MKVNKKKKTNIFFILGIILFRIAMEIALFSFVEPKYSYVYNIEFKLINIIISLLFFFLSLILIYILFSTPKIRFSQFTILLIYLLSFIPTNILSQYCSYEINFIVLSSLFWIFILIGAIFLSRKKIKNHLVEEEEFKERSKNQIISNTVILIYKKDTELVKILFFIFVSFMCAYAVYLSYKINGLKFILNLDEIYVTREKASTFFNTFDSFFINIFSTSILPILLGFAIKKKNILISVIIVLISFLMFSIGGNKSYILVILLSIVITPFFSDKIIKYIPTILAILFLLVLIVYKITNSSLIIYAIDVGIRRTFFTPAEISHSYFLFFQNNSPIWLTDDPLILRLFWEGPYDGTPLATVVGLEMYNETGTNTGMFGNAMGEFGNLGVIFFPILFLILIFIMDLISNDIENKTILPFIISFSVIIINISICGILWTFILELFGLIFLFKLSGLAYYNKGKNKKRKCLLRLKRNCK